LTGRILLIEADVILGSVLEEILRHNGYQVIFVRTFGDAKHDTELIRRVTAVILDVDTTTGEQELAWLGLFEPPAKFLSVVLIGLDVPDALRHRQTVCCGRQIIQLDWVKKPFRNEQLLEAVRRAHERTLLVSASLAGKAS
jgi:DNA-binding NtrC family response regulator